MDTKENWFFSCLTMYLCVYFSRASVLMAASQPAAQSLDESSAISPQLRHAQKTGDLYNISVNLNALQRAARSASIVISPRPSSSHARRNHSRFLFFLCSLTRYLAPAPLKLRPYGAIQIRLFF